MSLNPDSTKHLAKIQRTPDGHPLGAAIFVDAEIIEPFVSDGTEEIEFELIRMPSGVHIEIEGYHDPCIR